MLQLRERSVPLWRFLAVGTAVLSVALSSGIDAQAATNSQTNLGPIPVGAVSAPMTLDCSNLSSTATSYATSHGLCPLTSNGPVPDNTQKGNCGTSSLYIVDAGGGRAKFLESALSSLGNIVYVHHHVNWTNWSLHTNGSVDGNTWWNNIYWSNADYANTNSGYVTASQNGWVLLWWGGTCDFIPTSDGIGIG